MKQSDIPAVIEVMNWALSESNQKSGGRLKIEFSESENREYLNMICESEESIGLVAEEHDIIAGYIVAIPAKQLTEPLSVKTLWIDDIAVRDTHQRQGFGTRLISGIEERARRHGYQHIRLNVHEFNVAAASFYAAAGYENLSRIMTKSI